MNRNLHSPTKLTEFARDFDSEPETLFNKFVNRITNAYNSGYNSVNNTQCNVIAPGSPSTSGLHAHVIGDSSTNASNINKTITNVDNSSSLHENQYHELRPSEESLSITSSKDSNNGDKAINLHHNQQQQQQFDDISVTTEDRTPNVIARLTNLMASQNNNLTSYSDSEFKKFWMPDSKSKECYECSQLFTVFRRKHHCRLCGQIFCSKCCNQVVPGKIMNCSGNLKVCTYCSKIVLSYLKSPNVNFDVKSDLQALQDDLSNKFTMNSDNQMDSNRATDDNEDIMNDVQNDYFQQRQKGQLNRKISVGYQEERLVTTPKVGGLSTVDRKNILQQSNSLKSLHDELLTIYPFQCKGTDLIMYLINNQKSSNKIQAIAILNALIEANFLVSLQYQVPVTSVQQSKHADDDRVDDNENKLQIPCGFNENLNYKLIRLQADQSLMTSSGSFQLNLDLEANSVHLSRPPNEPDSNVIEEKKSLNPHPDSSIPFTSTKDYELQNSVLSTTGSKLLLETFCDHEESLLTQLLTNENLEQSWSKILIPLCASIANSIRPELCGMDSMDIRNFVNFKKVPGGTRNESKIIGGIVFSKNVVHKDMATEIKNPRILLLQCAIVYQRVEGKFVSIETLLLQENEYLRNVTARILSFNPNVVLVHKNVAGIAQDMLRNHGITLVLDVKLSVLERLSRCLKCDVITSIDSNIGRPKLGVCDRFYVRNYDDVKCISKTLMFFEINSTTPRNYCVLLRSHNYQELMKVKRVASLLLFARFNWRLELSLLLDEFARPPSPKPSIFDSKESSPSERNISTNNYTINKDKDKDKIIDDHVHSIKQQHSIIDDSDNKNTTSGSNVVNIEKRKCDKRLITDEKCVTKENVQDFSDPLRAIDLSPSKFDPNTSVEFAVEMPYDNRFRTALSSTVLSVSPLIVFPLPYLETEQGRKCKLRKHFSNELYYSKQWCDHFEKPLQTEIIQLFDQNTKLKPIHEFLTHKITTSIDNKELQTLLANFRSFGGRLPKSRTMSPITRKIENQQNEGDNRQQDKKPKDALDLVNHQRLPVLFCSYYYDQKACASFCAQPSLLNMIFYGQNDIMLGQFLERYCFRSSYICPSCNLPMLNHIRRYVHSTGCIQVKLSEDLTTTNLDQILMTSYCVICEEMTPSVPMSKDTWCLSFAKYLELRFHGHAYKRRIVDMIETTENTHQSLEMERTKKQCPHSLHKDHIQYFSYDGIVASFMYTTIEIWEIELPALILEFTKPMQKDGDQILEEIRLFACKGYEVYARIYEKLAQIAADIEFPSLTTLKQIIQRDQLHFRERVTTVQTLLTEPIRNTSDINDAMLLVKKCLAENIDAWIPRLCDAINQSRSLVTTIQNIPTLSSPAPPVVPVTTTTMVTPSSSNNTNNISIDAGTICTEDLRPDIDSPVFNVSNPMTQLSSTTYQQSITDESTESIIMDNQKIDIEIDVKDKIPLNISTGDDNGMSSKQFNENNNPNNSIPSSNHSINTSVSDKKSVKTKLRELLPTDKSLINNILQTPISIHEHLTLPTGQFPVLVHDQDLSSIIAYTLVSNEYKKALDTHSGYVSDSNYSPNTKRKSQDGLVDSSGGEDTKENDKKSKSSLHIEVFFQDSTTQFTCKIYFAREFDVMRTNFLKPLHNPGLPSASSVPPITSSSPIIQHSTLIPPIPVPPLTPASISATSSNTSFASPLRDVHDKTINHPISTIISTIEDKKNVVLRMQSQPELECESSSEFDNLNRKSSTISLSGVTTISTTDSMNKEHHQQPQPQSQHHHHHHHLNNNSIPLSVEDEIRISFARSLCKSIRWEARGGKSGSKFCKTSDDRFVLKEMSKQDVTIFENFAPNYFVYVNQCLQANQPTLLAKIFGVFKIIVKKKDSVQEKSLLVMENLFYDSNIAKKFDLKGSDRNRLVDPTNQNGEIVLLDENLIQMSWSKPLYILKHSKTILRDAINRDASFLEKNDVMDYSLLVGLNLNNKLLVFGIIDYIRTYTLDKRLESLVKQTGLLGGQGKLPTVISPKLYKQRFSEAMERYFLSVPDRWEGLAKK